MKVSNQKKSITKTHRRKKDLCELCGFFEKDEEHECIENYVKADMRGQKLRKWDHYNRQEQTPKKTKEEVPEYVETPEKVLVDVDARLKTIMSYRERKGLCIRCGKDKNEDCENNSCTEDYTQSDLRNETEKENDPRTIVTPKHKQTTILDTITNESVKDEFLSSNKDEFFRLQSTETIALQRPFIVIDICPSDFDQRLEFEYIEFMSRKHKDKIIIVLGNFEDHYNFVEVSKIKKLMNVISLRNMIPQNIVNHLSSCEKFFGFPSKYLTYCMMYEINSTTFYQNDEGYELPCDIVDLQMDKNVNLDILKTNVLSWRA